MSPYKRNEIACLCGWLVTSLAVAAYALWCAAKRLPLWTLAAVVLVGCRVDYSALASHKEACVKIGNDLIQESKAQGEVCWVTELRLGKLVETDPDCQAYWGDAGVDLCSPLPEGGADACD